MSTISPNMNLVISTVGIDSGLLWEQNLNASLLTIDNHNHTPGNGVQITPAGLNINAPLAFNGQQATNIGALLLAQQSSLSDLNAIFVGTDGNLYFNDGAGDPSIQITAAGAVNATSSGISSGTATASFVSSVLVVNAAPNTPANIQGGSILLGNNVANSKFLTLKPPNAMAADFSLTLPSIPIASSFLQIDTSGNIVGSIPVSQGITASNIANQTITAAQIANATITNAQIAAGTILPSNLGYATNLTTQSFGTYTPSFNVRAATTVNGALGTAYHNGSVIDGVTLATNDIILIKNQTTSTEDGVYVVQLSGTPVRHVNYDTAAELNFAGVHVTSGSTQSNSNWFQNDQLTTLADPQSWSKAATQAFTVPAGVTEVLVMGYGGGGGGAGGATSTGAGGSAGASAQQGCILVPVTPSQIIPVTQGLGGAGGAAGSNPGIAGTDTIFGSLVTFVGGSRGTTGGGSAAFSGGASGPGNVASSPGGNGANSPFGLGGVGGAGAGFSGQAGAGGGGGAGSTLGGSSAAGGSGGAGGSSPSAGGSAAALSGAGGGGGGGGGAGGAGGSGFLVVAWVANA